MEFYDRDGLGGLQKKEWIVLDRNRRRSSTQTRFRLPQSDRRRDFGRPTERRIDTASSLDG